MMKRFGYCQRHGRYPAGQRADPAPGRAGTRVADPDLGSSRRDHGASRISLPGCVHPDFP